MRRPDHLSARALNFLVVAVIVVLTGIAGAGTANAHGEDKQPPSLRTGTIQFYDVDFSTREVAVGQPFTIRGQFYVSRQWAEAVAQPRTTQLTIVQPGPVALVKDRRIGGEFVPESMELEKGRSYAFEIDLVARRAGTWHLHPQIMVQGAGPLVGPGVDVTIEPDPAGAAVMAANHTTLQNGERINLETYNRGTAIVWHLFYIIPAVLFLAYWLAKPLVPRMALLISGRRNPDELLTKRDIRVTLGAAGAILAVMVAGMVYSSTAWPDQIPLQIKRTVTPIGVDAGQVVTVSPVGSGMFNPQNDTVEMVVRFENTGRQRADLQSFTTAGFRFEDQADATADGQLRVSEPLTLEPGAQKEVAVTLVSKVWAEDELIPGRETGNTVGGLFMFAKPGDVIEIAEVSLPVIAHTGPHTGGG